MTPSRIARRTSIAIDKTHTSEISCWPSIRRSSERCRTCCGRGTMFRISSWIVAGLIMATPLLADDQYQKKFSRTFTVGSGERVTIDHRYGRVEVTTTSGNEGTVRGTIRASDDELGRQIHFEVSSGAGGTTIKTVYPDVHYHGQGHISYSADLDVTIPERAQLLLKNRFGSVEVS